MKLKQAVPYDIQAVLESLFFRSYTTDPIPETHRLKHLRNEQVVVTSVDLAKKALDFMNHVRKRQAEDRPYHVKEWRDYISKNGLTISTYETIKISHIEELNNAWEAVGNGVDTEKRKQIIPVLMKNFKGKSFNLTAEVAAFARLADLRYEINEILAKLTALEPGDQSKTSGSIT